MHLRGIGQKVRFKPMINIADQEVEMVSIRVAEKLGWQGMQFSQNGRLVGSPPGQKRLTAVPSYALDIKAAWEIIDLLTKRQVRISIVNEAIRGDIRNYVVEIGNPENPLAKASHRTIQVAVCLAFLKMPELRTSGDRNAL